MSVQRAKFEQKGEGYVAKAKPKKKNPSAAVEKKMDRTLGWGGFDDIAKPTEVGTAGSEIKPLLFYHQYVR